jgi:hypothetical protein
MAGYRENFTIYLTHKLALRKQNAFKKAMLFLNLTEICLSCIILRLEKVVTLNKFLD